MTKEMIQVFIADNSYVLRKGLTHLLQQFSQIDEIKEIEESGALENELKNSSRALLLINTSFANQVEIDDIKQAFPNLNIVFFINTPLPTGSQNDVLSISESKSSLMKKVEVHLEKLIPNQDGDSESEELSNREKLILKHVALGLTNKEIANELFISTHTVISHRKNITRKLGIKTVSGLTVYAILNNLISMNEIS